MELVTRHARARMHQRGIRAEVLEALLDYGREVHAGGGCDLVFFDKRARARLPRENAALAAQAARVCKSYAIVGSEGSVITVGHRFRRIPR